MTPFAFFLSLGVALLSSESTAKSGAELGLTLSHDETLMRHGQPYRGIEVSYYDAFIRALRDPNDQSYQKGFDELDAAGIAFARFSAGGFFAKDIQLYLNGRNGYLRRLDGVVATAEKARVGLIPALFWSISATSDAAHEPRERWWDARSQTRQLMRKYTQDVVSHYADSPATLGWEFSCELSLAPDMRKGAVSPERALSDETFRSAALYFASVVRTIDPHCILLTGNSLPRPNAYHNTSSGGGGPNTEAQFAHILFT